MIGGPIGFATGSGLGAGLGAGLRFAVGSAASTFVGGADLVAGGFANGSGMDSAGCGFVTAGSGTGCFAGRLLAACGLGCVGCVGCVGCDALFSLNGGLENGGEGRWVAGLDWIGIGAGTGSAAG